jgi:predicted thioesterase
MLEPGLTAPASLVVGEADLAPAHRSGDVPVLATPRLVALCEEATVAALDGRPGGGRTTVGTRVEIDHFSPSPAGTRVEAVATLESVDGQLLRFRVTVSGGGEEIASGVIHRAIVDREPFLQRAGL